MNTSCFRQLGLACVATVWVTGVWAQPCVDLSNSARTYLGPPYPFLFLDYRAGLNCDSAAATLTAPASYDPRLLKFNLEANASAQAGVAHARAKSAIENGENAVAGRGIPFVAFADADASVNFRLTSLGAPSALARISFEVQGDGVMASRADGSVAGAGLKRHSTAQIASEQGSYSDSDGTQLDYVPDSLASYGGMLAAMFDFTYTGLFGSGQNWFEFDLSAYAFGNASSDFGNTTTIREFTLFEPDAFAVELPAGMFTEDPNQRGHYTLTSLLPGANGVSEPTTPALVGIALWLWWLGRLHTTIGVTAPSIATMAPLM